MSLRSYFRLCFCTLAAALAGCLCGCGRTPLDIPIPPAEQDFTCTQPALTIPDDPGVRGPWPVGARTVAFAHARRGTLTAEIWYPAVPGSEAGQSRKEYDLRRYLPDEYGSLIPDEAQATQTSDCYERLPLDSANGPYPVIIFIHGFASFRTQSAAQTTHWASRGFVVISADHPGIQLRDILSSRLLRASSNQPQDAIDIIAALHNPGGEYAFLSGSVDLDRIGVSGHSAGASAAALLGDVPGVRVAVLMSGREADAGAYLTSALIMGAENDEIIPYESQVTGYAATNTACKRLLGIANAGHMAFTEICSLLVEDGGLLEVATRYGVPVPGFFKNLGTDGCADTQTPPETGWELINYASSAVFEETLLCSPERRSCFDAVRERFSIVLDYEEQLTCTP